MAKVVVKPPYDNNHDGPRENKQLIPWKLDTKSSQSELSGETKIIVVMTR